MTGVDARSVGELILEADLTARALLWDPDPATLRDRARTFGEVVEAAADLWAAIPDRNPDPTMGRIHAVTVGLHKSHQTSGWPGPGPADPDLRRIADALTAAADLVRHRRDPRTTPPTPAGHRDAEAARTRIAHVVYATAHAVTKTLDAHIRDLHRVLDARQRITGQSLKDARATRERVDVTERLAGTYLRPRWPDALTGEHRDPTIPDRLEQALAGWDLHAHRTLTTHPTLADVYGIARIHQELTATTSILTTAAVTVAGASPADGPVGRQRQAIGALERAWGQLAADLRPLVGRQRRLDPPLLDAANQLRAATRAITHDHAGVATPAVIAARTDLHPTLAALQHGLVASVDLAHLVRDTLTDPTLTGHGRAAHTLAATTTPERPTVAWVDAGDLHHDRPVLLPDPTRHVLHERASSIIDAAVAAAAATSTTTPERTPAHGEASPAHRSRPQPVPALGGQVRPGWGCDR